MTTEPFTSDLFAILVSIAAFAMSMFTFIHARRDALIRGFISVTESYFTSETREHRRYLRNKESLTNLKEKDDLNILNKEENQLKPEEERKVWEVVSAYNRLGFVLHKDKHLRNQFLEWDSETVIDMWKRVRLYVCQERKKDPGRKRVGNKFEWLFDQAKKYEKRK